MSFTVTVPHVEGEWKVIGWGMEVHWLLAPAPASGTWKLAMNLVMSGTKRCVPNIHAAEAMQERLGKALSYATRFFVQTTSL
jgi:hypothetical protein